MDFIIIYYNSSKVLAHLLSFISFLLFLKLKTNKGRNKKISNPIKIQEKITGKNYIIRF